LKKRQNPLIEFLSESRLPWIVAGVICAFVSMLPFFLLGEDSVVTYHDQLDGELITYLLNSKHLFDGIDVYPELMNGINKAGLVSPSPLFVLLFKVFKPFTAFLISMAIVRLVSVVFMFLLLDELTEYKFLSFTLAIVFMLLPFYTVYGLCIPGQPMVYYSLLRFKKEKWEWSLYFCIVLYVACSSLALVGYAMCIVVGVALIISIIRKVKWYRYLIACGLMGVGYVVENLPLVKQFAGISDGFASHKSEVVHTGVYFLQGLKDILLEGADYTKAYQKYYLPIILIALFGGLIFILLTAGDKYETEKTYKHLVVCTLVILVTAVVTVFFDGRVFAKIANTHTGVLHDFNFGRFSWLLTTFWILEFAISLKMLWIVMRDGMAKGVAMVCYSIVFVSSIGITAFLAVYNSDLKSNVVKLMHGGDYYMLAWQQFYAEDLFAEVEELIGRDKSEYRVVSLGIYPAAAAYNGFYCLDAYSNNYDVEYKHEFGEVIRPQLDKSEYLTKWFDEWGNRCYIVLNESMNYFTFEKKWGTYSVDYELNFDKLREMGCEYIISASYLLEPEKFGLTLLNEEPIETESSWYRFFVYGLGSEVQQ